MGSTLIYAAIGVAMGIVAGTALAASPWFANKQASAPNLGQVTVSAAESKHAPVAVAVQTPKIASPAQSQGNDMLSAAVKSAAVNPPAVRTASARKRFSAWRRASFNLRAHRLRRTPAIAPTPPLAAPRVSYAVERYTFVVEGDVTVVDYDASLGTIETHEGKTFVIGRTAAESWQDYRANVHYRCDQSGTCTLMRAGLVVPNARLSL